MIAQPPTPAAQRINARVFSMTLTRSLLASAALGALMTFPASAQNVPYPTYQGAAPAAPTQPAAEPLEQAVPAVRARGADGGATRSRSPAELKPLGLEQKAWANPRQNMGPRQTMPGFLKVTWRPDVVTTINVREGMLTVIRWPMSETILSRELSDKKTFESRIGPDQRSIIIRPVFAGVDGNMVVYGQSGNVYNIYLRSLPFNSPKLPDTTVEMIVGGLSTSYGGTLHSTAPASSPYEDYRELYKPAVTTKVEEFRAGSREWANSASLNPKDMQTNIDILVPDREDQAIAPIRAWHDKNFTYLDFGPNAGSMNQWPVAALLTDGSETPVGTRTTGKNGSIMVIEAIGDMVLRNGRHLVCLKLRNQPDNRVSPATVVARADTAPATLNTIRVPAPGQTAASPKRPAKATQTPARKRPVVKGDVPATQVQTVTHVAPAPVAATHMTRPAQDGFRFDASGLTGKIQ